MISSNVQWQALPGPGASVPPPSAFGLITDTPSINNKRTHFPKKIDKELNDKHKSKSKIGNVRIWAAVTPPTIELLRGQMSVEFN